MLHRVIRYAVERRRWDEAQRQLHAARVSAQENARLERGLLPSPVLNDPRLRVATQYRAGGEQRLLGGDFYDVVQAADGWVHALVGDVCGHGPAEAALGVCLRAAWRALVLAGQARADVLSAVQLMLLHEQQEEAMFATVCMLSVAPDRRPEPCGWPVTRRRCWSLRSAITELTAPACPPPGLNAPGHWPAREVELGDRWSLLMYTDGLIEGRIAAGPHRLGTEGLMDLLRDALGTPPFDPGLVSDEALLGRLIEEVRDLNSGDLNDDIAILGLGYAWRAGRAGRGQRPGRCPWPLSRIIGGAVLLVTVFSLAAVVIGGAGPGAPGRRAGAGRDHDRPRRAVDPAALQCAAQPGDRRARLCAERPGRLPPALHLGHGPGENRGHPDPPAAAAAARRQRHGLQPGTHRGADWRTRYGAANDQAGPGSQRQGWWAARTS